METKIERRAYQKPRIVSERVFEQAALACSQVRINTSTVYTNLKNDSQVCGYAHS